MAGEALLDVRAIDASYGDVRVLTALSLDVREGEIVTLLGANGAGKTTTLRCICGILPPRSASRWCRRAASCGRS
jgi:branched-chain amino acid transport system ATP-binding protein